MKTVIDFSYLFILFPEILMKLIKKWKKFNFSSWWEKKRRRNQSHFTWPKKKKPIPFQVDEKEKDPVSQVMEVTVYILVWKLYFGSTTTFIAFCILIIKYVKGQICHITASSHYFLLDIRHQSSVITLGVITKVV